MPHSRVLERVQPVNISAVPSTAAGTTYRFTLPYEVAGFCTLLLQIATADGGGRAGGNGKTRSRTSIVVAS